MIRKEAVKIASEAIVNCPIISANGYISRDLFEIADRETNFYMIGSMGLSSSIALGVALKNPRKRVYVFDGDGNILMNLGSLTTIGKLKQKNLILYGRRVDKVLIEKPAQRWLSGAVKGKNLLWLIFFLMALESKTVSS